MKQNSNYEQQQKQLPPSWDEAHDRLQVCVCLCVCVFMWVCVGVCVGVGVCGCVGVGAWVGGWVGGCGDERDEGCVLGVSYSLVG